MNEEEAYEHGKQAARNAGLADVAEVLSDYADEHGREAAYQDVFTGEPQNLVQDVRERAPIALEQEEDGRIVHAWDEGVFDGLLQLAAEE